MKTWLQKLFIHILVKHLFNTITEEDILRLDKRGVITFRGEPMDAEFFEKMQQDAYRFENSALWRILTHEIKYRANKRMYYRGKTSEDILAGKLMLYTLDIVEKKLQFIREMKI